MKMIKITQSLEDLKKCYPNFTPRSSEHKFKANNWLKLHGRTMRRKPFKRENNIMMIDEFWMIH